MQEKAPDNQNFFRALFWAMLVFLIWTTVAGPLFRPKPDETTTTDAVATSDHATDAASESGSPVSDDSKPKPGETEQGVFRAVGVEQETFVTLGDSSSKESPYPMELSLCSAGASIDQAWLTDHRTDVGSTDAYRLLKPIEFRKKTWRSLAIERVTIDDTPLDISQVNWSVEKTSESGGELVRFRLQVNRGDQPILELTRTFVLLPQPADERLHDLGISLELRNLTDTAHEVIVTTRGAVGLQKEGGFGTDRKAYAATIEAGEITLNSLPFNTIAKEQLRKLYARADDKPLLWYASGNLYFTCTQTPVDAEGRPSAGFIDQIDAFDIDGNKDTEDEVTIRVLSQFSLAPQSSAVSRHDAYLGPKDRHAFESHARYTDRRYMLQITDNYGSCTFGFLIQWMTSLLDWLESVIPNYGVAIILLVIVVRTLLHPITKKTQINMVHMQQNMAKVQPKVDEIKRKYAGDNRKMQEEMMKVYRDEGINPVGQLSSCLPMLLQMPIWIALYSSLNNNVGMRGRGFVFWIEDLTAPDCLYRFGNPIDLPLIGELECFSLLPILVGLFMFAQQKLMPKPKKQEGSHAKSPQAEQAEQMQKIMPYVSLIMIPIFYKFPSGLNLYILTSSVIGTCEQIYIRRHIAQYEAKERDGLLKKKTRKPLPGAGLWQRLQKQAEEAQKLRGNRNRPRK